MLRGRSYRWTGPVRIGGSRVLLTSLFQQFWGTKNHRPGPLTSSVATRFSSRSLSKNFGIQKFTKITLNHVGFIESGNERAVYRIAGGACCRASQSCRLGRTSRPLGKNKMRRTWLQTKFALLTACYRHSVGAFYYFVSRTSTCSRAFTNGLLSPYLRHGPGGTSSTVTNCQSVTSIGCNPR